VGEKVEVGRISGMTDKKSTRLDFQSTLCHQVALAGADDSLLPFPFHFRNKVSHDEHDKFTERK
jgi:hypothetical protein